MDISHLTRPGPHLSAAPLLPDYTLHPAERNLSIDSGVMLTQLVPNDRSGVRLWIKYSLFGFNGVLWVIGVAMTAVGIWAVVEKATVNVYKMANIQFDPAAVLLVVGMVVFIIGFTGCIGALRENVTLLSIYVLSISMIFILEIILLILVLVYKDVMYDKVKVNLQSMIVLYRDDADLQSFIDWTQEDWLQCCGIDGPDDWDENIYFNCSSPSREACGVPHSCCIPKIMESLKNLQCGYDARKQSESKLTIYDKGCSEKLQMWLDENQNPLLIAISIILTIQMSTMSLGLALRKDIRTLLQQWDVIPHVLL